MPGNAVEAVARQVAPSRPLNRPAKIAPSAPAPIPERRLPGTAELIFDAKWYATRYPDVPPSADEAYRSYIDAGMKMGRSPNALFDAARFPLRCHLPEDHLFRVTASPILCRVPPARYLEFFRPERLKKRIHPLCNTLNEYLRCATLIPDLVGTELREQDLRVAAYLDGLKNKFSSDFSAKPQEELISIILPTRNRANTLADVIASVLMQSYENWELIIVDDASDAGDTEALVTQFSDRRISFIRLSERGGFAAARNMGIARSSGTAIAHLEDDTLWDPDCLLVLLNAMRMHGVRMGYGAQMLWDDFDPDARLGRAFTSIRFSPFNRSLLENANYIATAALIHDRTLLDEVGVLDPSLTAHSEWDLILRLTEGERPIAIPCLLSHAFAPRPAMIVSPPEGDSEGEAGTAIESVPIDNPASGDAGAVSSGIAPINAPIPADQEAKIHLAALRARLAARSDWSQSFTVPDGGEQLAFSIGRRGRESRRRKLSALPVEPVQILIPNYESLSELEMCLGSLAEHTPTPYQILVIDNGSSDETYAELSRLPRKYENLRVMRESEASGFTFAVNRGLDEVADRRDPILILNNDTLVTPDWLDELRYVLWKHEGVGMAVPRQVVPADTKATAVHMPAAMGGFECDINLSVKHDNIVDQEFDLDDDLIELSYAPLFCSLIRPEIFKALGKLDSRNGPHYRSDWILCDSMRRFLNQRVVYTPHSKVYHLQGVATRAKQGSAQAVPETVETGAPAAIAGDPAGAGRTDGLKPARQGGPTP